MVYLLSYEIPGSVLGAPVGAANSSCVDRTCVVPQPKELQYTYDIYGFQLGVCAALGDGAFALLTVASKQDCPSVHML